jgi:hypothetical protein
VIRVQKPHGDLHSGEVMLAGKLDGSFGMLKIKRLEGVGGPIAQTAAIKTGTGVLQ